MYGSRGGRKSLFASSQVSNYLNSIFFSINYLKELFFEIFHDLRQWHYLEAAILHDFSIINFIYCLHTYQVKATQEH